LDSTDSRQARYFRSLRRLVFLGLTATVSLASAVLLLWEVLFHAMGLGNGDLEWPFLLRGFSTALLIAGFAAGFFWKARRRLDREWAEIARREAELEELSRCEDDSLGLAALSRALAHELRGTLHAIALRAAMVRKLAQGRGEVADLARGIEEEAAREGERLRSYGEAAGDATRSLRRERVDLAALLRLAGRELAKLANARQVALELPDEGERGPQVAGDPLLLLRALRVLVRGAVEAALPGTAVGLRTSVSDGAVALTMSQGTAADAEAPFGKAGAPAAARAALRLALVKDVARAHGGELVVAGGEAGSAVTLRLPVSA
jgi:signal transduction histidine kinase